MKTLAIDIGAGTQDIMYYDDKQEIENSIKLVLPSPPKIISRKIEKAEKDLYFSGETMGGGKIKNHIIEHLKKGHEVVMEMNAAKTIKDDLNTVENIGIKLIKEKGKPEDSKYSKFLEIKLTDIDIEELSATIANYDLDFSFDQIAVAVQDHGYNENKGDRDFRFEKIREKLVKPLRVEEFAYYNNVPDYFTRMKAVERTLSNFNPILMDSKFASICGACEDKEVKKLNSFVVMDIGNGHTMATSIENNLIQGVFEHHTSSLTPEKIESLINKLISGKLTHKEVHDDNGHGAYVINPISKLEKVIVTGPKRGIIEKTNLDYYNASPGGDVMMTGPIGLIKSAEYLKNKGIL